MYDKLSYIELKNLCKERGIQNYPGTASDLVYRLKQQDIELDKAISTTEDNNETTEAPAAKLYTLAEAQAELEKLKAESKIDPKAMFNFNISDSKRRIDDLKHEINDIFKTARAKIERQAEHLGRNPSKYRFFELEVDESKETIHFKGGTRGLVCTTLRQPDKTILQQAKLYSTLTEIGNSNGLGDINSFS